MDVEKELKKETSLPVKENRFLKAPKLPYIIYIIDKSKRGADDLNNISDNNITIEFYSEKIEKNIENKIENLLERYKMNYDKNREWLDDEKMFITVFEFNFLEKECI